jgi:hypothetical protein
MICAGFFESPGSLLRLSWRSAETRLVPRWDGRQAL